MKKLTHRTLKNGMDVILAERHSAPVVAFQLWAKVGSADEKPDEAGLAHVCEHMLFKGTDKRAVGEIARDVEACGGDINAWTSFDETVYHFVLPSSEFDQGLDIISDAVQNSKMDPVELKLELSVILEEIRRGNDMPSSVIGDMIFARTFRKHPYGRPIIGFEKTVRSFDDRKLKKFYRKWYVPSNLTLVVAGDFDPRTASGKISRAFREFKGPRPPARKTRVKEPVQKRRRFSMTSRNVQEVHVAIGIPVVPLTDPRAPLFDLLALIMGQGESSRLNQNIRRRLGLVNDIYSYAYTPRDAGIFLVGASMPAANLERFFSEIMQEIFQFSRENIPEHEMAKAKLMLESETIYQLETAEGLARRYGSDFVHTGDFEFDKKYKAIIAAADVQSLMDIAGAFFNPGRMSVCIITPDASTSAAEGLPVTLDGSGKSIINRAGIKEWINSAVRDTAGKPLRSSGRMSGRGFSGAGSIIEEKLDNGTRLLLWPDPDVPILALRSAFPGGAGLESPEKAGIGALAARSLTKGTMTRDASATARAVEGIAGSILAASGRNSFGLQASAPSKFQEYLLDLFFECKLEPAFRESEIETEKNFQLEAIRTQDDNPGRQAFKNMAGILFPDHVYGLPVSGTHESVTSLTAEDCTGYYRGFSFENMVICAAGNFDRDQICSIVSQKLGEHPGFEIHREAKPPVPSPLQQKQSVFRKNPKEQAHIVIGFRGNTLYSDDRFALEVLITALSGMGGRLFDSIREKAGLAYHVSASNTEALSSGMIALYGATSPENTRALIDAFRKETEKVRLEKLYPDELDRVKSYLIGMHKISLQRLMTRASLVVLNVCYDLGTMAHVRYIDRIAAVSAQDVIDVAVNYLDFDRSVLSIVGPETSRIDKF